VKLDCLWFSSLKKRRKKLPCCAIFVWAASGTKVNGGTRYFLRPFQTRKEASTKKMKILSIHGRNKIMGVTYEGVPLAWRGGSPDDTPFSGEVDTMVFLLDGVIHMWSFPHGPPGRALKKSRGRTNCTCSSRPSATFPYSTSPHWLAAQVETCPSFYLTRDASQTHPLNAMGFYFLPTVRVAPLLWEQR
jgi:hypothetical protein